MQLKTQEHCDIIKQFERDLRIVGRNAEKEAKDMWPKGCIYTHGETNQKFLVYRQGYAFGRAVYLNGAPNSRD